MKVVCAWCEQEGQGAVLSECAPLHDDRFTHGICSVHQEQYLLAGGTGGSGQCVPSVSAPRRAGVGLFIVSRSLAGTAQGASASGDRSHVVQQQVAVPESSGLNQGIA
ncbi:MAG: hypothetical protein U0172_11525 [Nitrospiraceae bacterium]